MSASSQGNYIDPVIDVYKRDVDRGLLRESLKRTPENRIRRLQELHQLRQELSRAMRRAQADR